MIIKLVGSFIVIISSVCIGRFYAQKIKYRLEALKELKRIITIIESDIGYLATPLPEIMGQNVFVNNKIYGEFFKKISIELEKGGAIFSEIWNRCIDNYLNSMELTHIDKEEIKKVGVFNRGADRQRQINQYEHLKIYLENEIEILNREVSQKTRLYNLLGFSFGMFIVIACF